MMLRKMPVLLLPLVLLCPAISDADESRPAGYDECILDAMRGVSSDIAARAIIDSCRNLFPETPPEAVEQAAPTPIAVAVPAAAAAATPAATKAAPPAPEPLDTTAARSLTADELARLRSRARVFGDAYRVTVDNGNPDLTLTEVTIAVWDDNDSVASRMEYSEAVQIAPDTSAEVKYEVRYRGDEAGWNWAVVGARGID
jgi:hypothetical protein